MAVVGIGSAAQVDPVAALVTALNAATAALATSTASSLQKSSNLSDVASASASRTSLGLSTTAVMSTAQIAADSALTGTYTKLTDPRIKRALGASPGLAGIPTVMTSPYTVTSTAVSSTNQTASASSITSAIHVRPTVPGAFTYRGGVMVAGPLVGGGSAESVQSYGSSSGAVQSQCPFAVEFVVDTVLGSFDLCMRDNTSNFVRIAVDGQYISQSSTAAPGNTGGAVIVNVSGLSAGRHRVSAEFAGGSLFLGVNVGPADAVHRTAVPPLGVWVVGDSYTEPTIVDSTSGYARWGWVQILGQLAGVNAVGSGSGGTGYLNPGSGGRVKFRDRLAADVLANSPSAIVWAGGINDYSYGSYTKAGLQAEATACFAAATAALPNVTQVVLSPFFGKGYQSYPTGLLEARDALQAAASAAGLVFVDVLEITPEYVTQTSGTLAANSAISATSVSSSVSIRAGSHVRIGASGAAEIRSVSSVSGTGPYTINLNTSTEGVLAVAHSSGDPIAVTGPGWITGTGKQGTTTGNGTADRYTGSDGTHPTSDLAASGGHAALARAVYAGLLRAAGL